LDPRFALAELHGGVTTTATLGTAEQEKQSTEEKKREDQTSCSLLPTGCLAGRLYSDVDVVLSEQTKQLTIRSKVDLRSTTVVLNNLSRALIRCDEHTADLIVLNSLDKFAVANGVDLGLISATTPEKGWCNHDNCQDQ
jgi:hypothetical protein